MKWISLFWGGLLLNTLSAQVSLLQRDLLWLNPRVEVSMGSKDKLSVEMEWRTFIFPQRTHQLIGPSLLYQHDLNDQWNVGFGGLHFLAYQPGNPFVETQEVTTEWRLHQEATYFQKSTKGTWAQRAKVEQRFFLLEEGTSFVLRTRYRLEYRYPFLWLKRKQQLRASAEPMWQFAEQLPFGHFDQVRLRLTLRVPIKPLELEIGYMYWFQQSGRPSEYLSHHIVPIGLTLKL